MKEMSLWEWRCISRGFTDFHKTPETTQEGSGEDGEASPPPQVGGMPSFPTMSQFEAAVALVGA